MPRYSYNNIILVTNVMILELLSAWFVHPGAPQLTILSNAFSLHHLRTDIIF